MTEMITTQKSVATGKTVLLFSGGMDSVMMSHLLKPDILLVIPHGQKYEYQELASIRRLYETGLLPAECTLRYDRSLDLKRLERDDAIIPSRNLLFLTIAANYGETLYFGAMAGDRSLDKSQEFFELAEDMLTYLFQPQHWCEGRRFEILAPYKHKTKTQLLKDYLMAGLPSQAIYASYSCYEGGSKPCGVCKPCFRKWVAMQGNNLNTDGYFKRYPGLADWLPEVVAQIRTLEGYRGAVEDLEIMTVLGLPYEKELSRPAESGC